jgi:hypothetical protein
MLRVGNLMHKNLAQVMEYRHVRYIRCLTRQKKRKKKKILPIDSTIRINQW